MKSLLVCFLLVFNVALPLVDAADLPKGTFSITQVEEAMAVALEKNWPILYLDSELNSDCPLCRKATENTIKSMRRCSVVVFFDCRTPIYAEHCPPLIYGLYCFGDDVGLGRIYPRGVLTDPTSTKALAIVPYKDLKDSSKLRAFKRGAKKWTELVPAKELDRAPVFKVKGKAIAHYGEPIAYDEKSDLVTIQQPSGKQIICKKSDLTPGAIRLLDKTFAGNNGSAKGTEESEPSFQVWTSAKGNKKLKAKFVELTGQQITLENEDGTELSFGLDKLSTESQELAKELAESR